MSEVLVCVVRVDHDVIWVDNHAHVQNILENFVHKTLEGCRNVCKTVVHHLKLVQSISSSERSLPFIVVCYAYEIVCTAKTELGEDAGRAKTVE